MKSILIFIFLSLGPFANSQEVLQITPGMLAKMDTSKPVQFTEDAQLYYDGSIFKDFYNKRFRSLGFTESELNLLMQWMDQHHFALFVQGKTDMSTGQSLLKYYKAYAIGNTGAIWIPKNKNHHMPPGMQPPMDEGMLVSTNNKSWQQKLTVAGTAPPEAVIAQAETQWEAKLAAQAEFWKQRDIEQEARRNAPPKKYEVEKCAACYGTGQVMQKNIAYNKSTREYSSGAGSGSTVYRTTTTPVYSQYTQPTICRRCGGSGKVY